MREECRYCWRFDFNSMMPFSRPYHCRIRVFLIVAVCLWVCHRSQAKLFINRDSVTNTSQIRCPLFLSFPFTANYEQTKLNDLSLPEYYLPSEQKYYAFSMLAASMLAIDHVNSRNGSLIPYLASEKFERCNFKIPNIYVDDVYDSKSSPARNLIAAITNQSCVESLNPSLCQPCAILGPHKESLSYSIKSVSSAYDIPILYTGMPTWNSDDDQLTLGITLPQVESVTGPLADFLLRQMERDYIGVLYINDSEGRKFVSAWKSSVEELDENNSTETTYHEYGVHDDFHDADRDWNYHTFNFALNEVKGKGFRTIVVQLDLPKHFSSFTSAVKSLGMDGNEYMWMLVSLDAGWTASPITTVFQTSEQGYLSNDLLSGMGIFSPSLNANTSRSFWETLLSSDYNFVKDTLSRVPGHIKYSEEEISNFNMSKSEEYQLSLLPAFLFDSIATAAVGACSDFDNQTEATYISSGKTFVNHIVNTSASGITGSISFDEDVYSRDVETVKFSIFNIQSNNPTSSDFTRKYQLYESFVWENNSWQKSEYPFLFRDGTENAPLPLRYVETNSHYINNSTRYFMFGLSLISIIYIVYCAVNRWRNNQQSVEMGTNKLHYVICLFSATLICTTFSMGFDGGAGVSTEELSLLCTVRKYNFFLSFFSLYTVILLKVLSLAESNRTGNTFVFMTNRRWVFLPLVFCVVVLFLTSLTSPLSYDQFILSKDQYGFIIESSPICRDTVEVFGLHYHLFYLVFYMVVAIATVKTARSSRKALGALVHRCDETFGETLQNLTINEGNHENDLVQEYTNEIKLRRSICYEINQVLKCIISHGIVSTTILVACFSPALWRDKHDVKFVLKTLALIIIGVLSVYYN